VKRDRMGNAMRGHGCGPNHAQGNDRRQTLAALLGAGLAGAAMSTLDRAQAEATKMTPIPSDEDFMRPGHRRGRAGGLPFRRAYRPRRQSPRGRAQSGQDRQ
jgi:hypothetical protein